MRPLRVQLFMGWFVSVSILYCAVAGWEWVAGTCRHASVQGSTVLQGCETRHWTSSATVRKRPFGRVDWYRDGPCTKLWMPVPLIVIYPLWNHARTGFRGVL